MRTDDEYKARELEVIDFFLEKHGDQRYGEFAYSYHLGRVAASVSVLAELGGFWHEDLVFAAWGHDSIEDTDATYEEVLERFGKKVADLIQAVTSEPGANRRERNARTYPKLRAAGPDAVFLKLCDRRENVIACFESKDSKIFMYQKEYKDFRGALRLESDGPIHMKLWDELDKLLGWWEPK